MQASPMLFTGIDWNTVRGVFGGKRVFKGISYLSVLDGHRYQVLTIISPVILQNFSDTGFLRHLMVSKMICFPTAGFRWVCKAQQSETSQPREIPHRVTWAALKLNMMFI